MGAQMKMTRLGTVRPGTLRRWLPALLLLVAALAAPAPADAAPRTYSLYVDGLACPFCSYGVEKKVGGLKGVEKVEIDIENGRVVVTLADGAILDEATARQAVDEAGFTLRKFEPPKK